MPWVLAAVDAGVEDSALEKVRVLRKLISEALSAANSGAQYTGVDRDYRVAAMLVKVGDEPHAIRCGVVFDLDPTELAEVAEHLGVDDVASYEIHWVSDIPLRKV